jgi:hypothetical protein
MNGLGRASTPCMHCRKEIVVWVRSRFDDIRPLMQAVGAVWDRGWFCSESCREAFNAYAPENGWDRALEGLKDKPKA